MQGENAIKSEQAFWYRLKRAHSKDIVSGTENLLMLPVRYQLLTTVRGTGLTFWVSSSSGLGVILSHRTLEYNQESKKEYEHTSHYKAHDVGECVDCAVHLVPEFCCNSKDYSTSHYMADSSCSSQLFANSMNWAGSKECPLYSFLPWLFAQFATPIQSLAGWMHFRSWYK